MITSTLAAAVLQIAVAATSTMDSDNDGLKDTIELALRTDPYNQDSDGDGYLDGEEAANGYNPLAGQNNRDVSRRVEVDLTKQRLHYFLNGIKIGTAPVSTGLPGMETPRGEFSVLRKVPVVNYIGPGYNLPNTKWNLEFKRHFYLHGAYWHNQFGIKPMSHGCVNIAYKDAEKLYKFLKPGDKVKIYGETPRGRVKVVAVTP